jgi:mono/diheme cytochrome c family protein
VIVALTTTSIAWVLFAIILIGWITYYVLNTRQARDELGSERELAANRKPFYDDETLEGPRLTRVLGIGVVLLAATVVVLPVYWILEPGRQTGAQEAKEEEFARWGARIFAPTGTYLESFNCAGCHGANGGGGVAAYVITDPATGESKAVNWTAPALNTIFYRFSEDEVRDILVYGRPFSPMSPWGIKGGGPMNDQQIDTLIAYIKTLQITRQDCGVGEDDPRVCPSGHLPTSEQQKIDDAAKKAMADAEAAGEPITYGEALFNSSLSSGAYSCARCHTPGWSYGDPGVPGQGALGWNLTGGAAASHFPSEADMITFIKNGSVYGAKYGKQGQGSGRMPGFGNMLTDAQIQAIVDYVRSL